MEEEKSEQQISPQASAAGPPQPDELFLCKEKLAKAEQERDEYLNGWKRAKADLLNYQREEMTRMEGAMKFGNERLLKELIAVMDSFDLALSLEKGKEEAPEVKGMMMIRSQLETFLKNYGVEAVRAVGEAFDPALHEAVAEDESEKPPGTVLEEVGRGWKLYTKVVRPARVKVAKQKLTTHD